MSMYLQVLDTGIWGYSDTPVEGYSTKRDTKKWKAHYYYQTIGNELVAFAYWLGLEFDTDEVWHSGDILSWEEEKKYDEIQEYLSEMFTYYEYEISKGR